MMADYLNIDILPVPRSVEYTQQPGETKVDVKEIEDYIRAQAYLQNR